MIRRTPFHWIAWCLGWAVIGLGLSFVPRPWWPSIGIATGSIAVAGLILFIIGLVARRSIRADYRRLAAEQAHRHAAGQTVRRGVTGEEDA